MRSYTLLTIAFIPSLFLQMSIIPVSPRRTREKNRQEAPTTIFLPVQKPRLISFTDQSHAYSNVPKKDANTRHCCNTAGDGHIHCPLSVNFLCDMRQWRVCQKNCQRCVHYYYSHTREEHTRCLHGSLQARLCDITSSNRVFHQL